MFTVVRSVLFNLLLYLNILIHLIIGLPFFALPRQWLIGFGRWWARTNLVLLRVVCGVRVELVGRDKIPPGPLLIAAKHQSMLETFTLILLFDDPTYIAKRELLWIPWFGWYLWKAGIVPVDRGARAKALKAMTARVRAELRRGRQIIIFPEGTRQAPGAPPSYKYGVAHVYSETGVPCLPIALNTGLVWGRRSFRRPAGTVTIEVLDPIPPGLDKQEFLSRLQNDIETATARLVARGVGNGA